MGSGEEELARESARVGVFGRMRSCQHSDDANGIESCVLYDVYRYIAVVEIIDRLSQHNWEEETSAFANFNTLSISVSCVLLCSVCVCSACCCCYNLMLYKRIDRSAGDMALGRMSTTQTHASHPRSRFVIWRVRTTSWRLYAARNRLLLQSSYTHCVCVLSMCSHSHSDCCSLTHCLSRLTLSWLFLFYFFLFFQLIRTEWTLMTQDSFFFGGRASWGAMEGERQRSREEKTGESISKRGEGSIQSS